MLFALFQKLFNGHTHKVGARFIVPENGVHTFERAFGERSLHDFFPKLWPAHFISHMRY